MTDQNPHFGRYNWPPTDQECSAILSLIEVDNKSLAALEQTEAHLQESLREVEDIIDSHKVALDKARRGYKTASHFLDTLRTSMASISQIELNLKGSIDSQAQDLTRLREMQEAIIQHIQNKLPDAETCAHAMFRAVQVADEELRVVLGKFDRLRAIWRVPYEIWTLIFQDVVELHVDTERKIKADKGSFSFWPWHQSLIPLTVCHRWRDIALANPRLWQNTMYRLDHPNPIAGFVFNSHATLTGGVFKRLVIWCRDLTTEREFLQNQTIKSVDSVHFDLTSIGTKAFKAICAALPPPMGLSIVDYSGEEMDEYEIPKPLCTSIKFLSLSMPCSITAAAEMPNLEQLTINRKGAMITLRQSFHGVLNKSFSSLRSLSVTGTVKLPLATQLTLNNLSEASMTINNLIKLDKVYRMPYLRRIVLLPSIGPYEADWDRFLSVNDRKTSIQEVAISSMENDDALSLLSSISFLPNVKTLELQGDSVEPIIQAWTSELALEPDTPLVHFPNVETLKVVSYDGGGEVMQELLQADRTEAHGQREGIETRRRLSNLSNILLVDCPNVSIITRDAIEQLLHP